MYNFVFHQNCLRPIDYVETNSISILKPREQNPVLSRYHTFQDPVLGSNPPQKTPANDSIYSYATQERGERGIFQVISYTHLPILFPDKLP